MKRRIAVVSICLIAVLLFCLSSCGKVEFELNFIVDDETYATVITGGNETIKMPDDPTKEGYTFDGWYWDKDVWQKPFTANSLLDAPLSSDMSVYAKFTLVDTKEPENQEPNTTPLQNCELASNHLTVSQTDVTGKVSNQIESFSFLADVKVANGASYTVCTDIGCTQTVPSKTINLAIGDNTFYILVTNADQMQLYTVTIRRLPVYTVSFETHGGTVIDSQTVEEGGFASKPADPIKSGYTFGGWNINIDSAITSNTQFSAIWNANTDTAYKVEYYLENISKNGYELKETKNLSGLTGATAIADKKLFEHFTLDSSKSTTSGKISADENLVLKLYYTRISYTISNNDTSGGAIIGAGTYPYGTNISLTATNNLGYDFLGWYNGNSLVSEERTYSGNISSNLVAKFALDTDIANFIFVSTPTMCQITGIKNKTVTNIKIPDYVTTISTGVLSGCSDLESICVPFVGGSVDATTASASTLFGYIFGTSSYSGGTKVTQYYNENASSATSYYIPSKLKNVTVTGGSIFYGAFDNCTLLTSIAVGENVIDIQKGAFNDSGYYNDESNWENGVLYIGTYLIEARKTIAGTYVIKDGTKVISDYAFQSCYGLTSITIPNSVTSIKKAAFNACSGLTSITIPNSVESIGSNAFYSCVKLIEVINKSSINITTTSYGLTALEVHSGESKIVVQNGYQFYTYNGVNYLLGYIGSDTALVFPGNYNGTKYEIYEFAFSHTNIISATTGDGITNIGYAAFSECKKLASIVIGKSVTNIGELAFNTCTGLKSIIIPDSVTSIGNNAFKGCSGLENVTVNGITDIGDYAFWYCTKLKTVTLNYTNSIGLYAFASCTNLTSIKYRGSKADWNSITKGKNWDSNTGNYTITYSYTGE